MEFVNEVPAGATGTQWDIAIDGKTVYTIERHAYDGRTTIDGDNDFGPHFSLELRDYDNGRLVREVVRREELSMDDMREIAGHAFNTSRNDVFDAKIESPDGVRRRITWRAVEVTGYDAAEQNVGMRSYVWDTNDAPPIAWKFVGGWGKSAWRITPTSLSLSGTTSWPVESREVEPGDILEPGDYYLDYRDK